MAELNTQSVLQQPKSADRRQCVYPNCGKMLKSSEESFQCCDTGLYCSSRCKQDDWSRHKTMCQCSGRQEKLECPKPAVAARGRCASCGKKSSALKHCAWCMNISYCSKNCQQTDWSRHKTVCQSSVPHNKPETPTPVAETRDQAVVSHECTACGKASESLMHCVRCRKASYCDRNCQQADWPRHKSICEDHEDKSEGLKPPVVIRDACASCGEKSDALKKCTGCSRVSYCNRNCQQADWPRHKSICEDHEDKSEGLKPLVVIRDACASCGEKSDALKKCTGCNRVSYCDRNCQKAHRSAHKAACGTVSCD